MKFTSMTIGAEGWNWEESADNQATAKSRSGYVTYFAEYIALFQLKLQTLVTQSTIEAEYLSLSHALRKTIPIMNLVDEMLKCELGTFRRKVKVG